MIRIQVGGNEGQGIRGWDARHGAALPGHCRDELGCCRCCCCCSCFGTGTRLHSEWWGLACWGSLCDDFLSNDSLCAGNDSGGGTDRCRVDCAAGQRDGTTGLYDRVARTHAPYIGIHDDDVSIFIFLDATNFFHRRHCDNHFSFLLLFCRLGLRRFLHSPLSMVVGRQGRGRVRFRAEARKTACQVIDLDKIMGPGPDGQRRGGRSHGAHTGGGRRGTMPC